MAAMSASFPPYVQPLGGGVFCIDTGFTRPAFDAAYLVVDEGRAAFIDTGTNFAVPRLLAALDAAGLAREDVDWVIPTHVHLDHAGGTGLLMRELPSARAVVHPRGLRHMVDPSALWQGALAVYGPQEMARSYGELVPVPAERTLPSHDGMALALGSRALEFADTPGHARHHHCIWDEATRGWFTGDTFGISYREFDHADHGPWILPASTPVQFDPEALEASVNRLMARAPQRMYITHFGALGEVPRLARQMLQALAQTVAVAEQAASAPDRHAVLSTALRALYHRRLAEHGCTLPRADIDRLLDIDVELNAQGIAAWLDRRASA